MTVKDGFLLEIDGVRVLVKSIELVGEPYVRDGELIQEARVTFFETLRFFTINFDSPGRVVAIGGDQ